MPTVRVNPDAVTAGSVNANHLRETRKQVEDVEESQKVLIGLVRAEPSDPLRM